MTGSTRNSLVLPVYVPSLILMFGSGMLIPILPLYAKTLSASYGIVGVVLAAEGVGRLIGALPAGILLGRVRRKTAMVLGVSCVAVSTLMLFWARDIYEVMFYRLAAGVGGSVWNIACHAYLTDATDVFSSRKGAFDLRRHSPDWKLCRSGRWRRSRHALRTGSPVPSLWGPWPHWSFLLPR